MKRETYNTKQKDIILEKVRKLNKEFTVKGLYDSLNHKVGLTTIYRLIDKLVEEGIIKKTITNDNKTFYRYLEECNHENHFYLNCDKCGNLVHVDCDCINELSNHIFKEHNFKPSKDHIIINGICNNCSKGE